MNLLYKLIAITLIVGFAAVAIKNINTTNQKLHIKGLELKSNEAKLLELNQKYDQVLKEKADTKAEQEKQSEQIKELESEKSRLERELSVKRENIRLEAEKLSKVAKKASGTQVAVAGAGCNTGNKYKDFIYYKESTCNPRAVNSIGCRGIAQACPGSKLPCGDDFACQDAWFSNYAIQRYGSWENAYNWWLQNHWW